MAPEPTPEAYAHALRALEGAAASDQNLPGWLVEQIEAQVRAKVAAEIRGLPPISMPTAMRRAPSWWNSLSGPTPHGLLEWAARIAEGKGDET